jgi:hypothetical protein
MNLTDTTYLQCYTKITRLIRPVWMICLFSVFLNSFPVFAQHHFYGWGEANLSKASSGAKLQLILHQRTIDSTIGTTVSCFVQVAPNGTMRVQAQRHVEHQVTNAAATNPSVLNYIKTKLQASSQSLVSLKGYRWFRGKRLAEVSVTSYILQAQTLFALDTIDIALSGYLETIQTPTIVDKHFQPSLNALAVNANTATATEALLWSDSTKTWLPANGKAIKITVPGDGVYRLNYTQLTTMASELAFADPTMFQLYNKGHELPMTVNTASASIFSSGDYLEFVGTKNYNPDTLYRNIPNGEEEYCEYLNRYTDTSYYWLVWGNAAGMRFSTNDTTATSIDSLLWYTENVHLEKNNIYTYCDYNDLEQQNPYWTSGDIWAWRYVYAGQSCDPVFSATQIQAGAFPPRILMKVAGSASQIGVDSAHLLQLGINSTFIADTSVLGPFAQSILRRTISTSNLNEGINSLHLYSYASKSSTNSIVFDWADVEYPRSLTTTEDSLWFGFRDLIAPAVRRVVLQGLTSSNIVIYKTGKYPKRIVGTVSGLGTYTISFMDTVRNGDIYVILSSAKIATPSITYKSSFADLRNSSRRADYLLLTESAFISLAEQYTSFIQTTYGLITAIINMNDIYDEFGYGYPVPEAEREFLKATTNWTSPMPSYVLLVGEANYDFKNYFGMSKDSYVRNIVPAFGMPVSDQWAAKLYDSLDIPQMYLGRLPVASTEEFQRYFTRLQSYATQTPDIWNKRYMFFAGGSDPSEYSKFHLINQQVISNVIQQRPVGGIAIDFYKTSNPVSNYGQYTATQAAQSIDSSALMITYIGHSGTETWDNDINDVSDLANTVGRYPLISDFGCSTGKFAEPNIRSFSEQFVVGTHSSAIGYIGNSSLGFEFIATKLPECFYEELMADSTHAIGKDMFLGKMLTMNQNGWNNSPMARQMMLTNTLIGDPAVRLSVPSLPNLFISSSMISSSPGIPSDDNDVASLTIPYHNLGSVPSDTFQVKVTHTYLTVNTDTLISLPVPLYVDTIHLSYVVKNLPGEHTFIIQLNPAHTVSESNYSDNSCQYSFVVQSAVYRIAYPVPGLNCPSKKFILLNPVKRTTETNAVTIMIDTSESFASASSYTVPVGLVVTSFAPADTEVKRYYWKTSDNSTSASGSFTPSSDSLTRWTQSLPSEWMANSYLHTAPTSTGVSLRDSTYQIEIISSGWNTVGYGAVKVNDNNVIATTFKRGITVVQLDTMDFHVIQQASFDTHADTTSLSVYLNAIADRSLAAMVVIDEAQSFLTQAACTAIKNFGSQYIDHIRGGEGYRAAWALFGRKGAALGESLESWHPAIDSLRATLDTTITNTSLTGYVLSPLFGPASQWTSVTIAKSTPPGSALGMYVLGRTITGEVDTLVQNAYGNTIDLTSFNAKRYRTLQLLGKFQASTVGETPLLNDWKVLLKPPPELAINYQCVSTTSDTLLEGNSLGITVKIFNAGEQPADSVKVVFSMNNGIRQKDTVLIPVIPADSFATVNYSLATAGYAGSNTETISIDPEKSVPEIYTVNNYYSFPFYVQKDTVKPSFDITFDGQRIYDGDYVLPNPTMRITIHDNSLLPIVKDSVHLFIDNQEVDKSTDPNLLFEPNSGSEKATVTYKSTLKGRKEPYQLLFRVGDASGNSLEMPPLTFSIDTVLSIKNVFNFPNPFASETHFTFMLTDYADEVEIKIYTIAGRRIQDIQVLPQFNANYKVYWNGQDHDGDEVANGVYFYKILAKSRGSTKEVIQKLVKVR